MKDVPPELYSFVLTKVAHTVAETYSVFKIR